MEKKELINKIKQTNSAITMLNLKMDILIALEGKKAIVPKEE